MVRWTSIAALLLPLAAQAIEEPAHDVVADLGEDVEVRAYAPYLVARTAVDGAFEAAGNAAFRRLFGYISGANAGAEEIAMTAPVEQLPVDGAPLQLRGPVAAQAAGDRWVVTFVMPAQFSMASLPAPDDPAVELAEVPERLVAVRTYSGTWSRARYLEELAVLRDRLAASGWEPQGEAVFARYDAPFMPWFLRRNEVQVAVAPPPGWSAP